MAMLKRSWQWLLARTTMQINMFQLTVWLPLCWIVAIALLQLDLHLNLWQLMIVAYVTIYVVFLPLIFDCVKEYLKPK